MLLKTAPLIIEQVTDVINGKKIIGPQDDIVAVKNAFNAYKELENINPLSVSDLLKTHKIMMSNLVEEAGMFRTSQVGIYSEKGEVIHIAPPCDLVPELIKQLSDRTATSKAQMLIRSSIFD